MEAQNAVTVTPDVRADVMRRIETARTSVFTRKPRKQSKDYMKTCNRGPNGDLAMSQIDACNAYASALHDDYPDALNIDDYMPDFKACALDPTRAYCSDLVHRFLKDGKPEYALALIEAGLIGPGALPMSANLAPDFSSLQLTYRVGPSILVGRNDVVSSLRSLCLTDAAFKYSRLQENPCSQARNIDAAPSADEINRAKEQREEANAAIEQRDHAARGLADSATAGREQRSQAILGALSSANQNMAHPMPYPSQTQASSTYNATTAQFPAAGAQSASGQISPDPGNSQCQWLTNSVSRSLQFNLEHAANYCAQGSRDVGWIYTNHSSTYVVCTVRAWSNGSVSNAPITIGPGAEASGEIPCARDGQSEYVCYPQVGSTASCLNVNWTIN
jgi:hypothetical protein